MNRDDLLAALQSNQVQAFLRVIREGESNQLEDAYNLYFGGEHFTSFADHPRQIHKVRDLESSAAGAYQFLSRTWDSLLLKYEFPDFSPINQDCGAVALIAGRGALQAVIEGRLDEALRLCAREWASLPGSPCGQPTLTQEKAREVFVGFGGALAQAPSPVPVSAAQKEVKPMPVFMALLPSILQLIPQLTQIFANPESAAQHNVAAANVVANTLVTATQSPNLQAAVERMQADPAALAAAQAAVSDVWGQLTEAGGGGIKAARDNAALSDGDWRKVVFNFPFLLAVGFLPLIYAVVAASLVKVSWLAEFTSDARMMVWTAVINLILGSIIGYVYGMAIEARKGVAK